MILNVIILDLLTILAFCFLALTFLLPIFSGASRAIASGDPASSPRATMGVGAPGQSLALAPEHVGVEFAPATDSATTLRECIASEEADSGKQRKKEKENTMKKQNQILFPWPNSLFEMCVHPTDDDIL